MTPERTPHYRPPSSPCCNAPAILLRFNCGPGGTQYRHTCPKCWRRGQALSHALLRSHGVDLEAVPRGDIELLNAAHRQCELWP